jgi:hypothetical protein
MHLDLDPSDINVVLQHLEQGQFRTVAPVLMKIQAQVMAQQQPAPQPDVAPEDTAAGGTD